MNYLGSKDTIRGLCLGSFSSFSPSQSAAAFVIGTCQPTCPPAALSTLCQLLVLLLPPRRTWSVTFPPGGGLPMLLLFLRPQLLPLWLLTSYRCICREYSTPFALHPLFHFSWVLIAPLGGVESTPINNLATISLSLLCFTIFVIAGN